MKNNQQSLSEQKQRRGNLILLIVGIVLLLLFFLALCSMPEKTKQKAPPVQVSGPGPIAPLPPVGGGEPEIAEFHSADGELIVSPSSLSVNSVVSRDDKATITLQAKNSSIRLELKKLMKENKSPFKLSGSCMEKGYDIIEKDTECTILVSWETTATAQYSDNLVISWRKDDPRATKVYKEEVPIFVNVTDSNPCVICKCEETKAPPEVVREVKTTTGEPLPTDGPNIIDEGGNPVPIPPGPFTEVDKKPVIVDPIYVPLNLKNELMGKISGNRDVLDFKGEVIGRLLGDNTIVSSELEILGKAIPFVPAMKEDGEIIGDMVIDEEKKSVYIMADGKILGYPRVDSQVIDVNGKPIAFLIPHGLVINFNGELLGGIYPAQSGKKKILAVLGPQNEPVGSMRPMGLALNKKGEVIGGVVPSGVAVGAGCQSFGTVSGNGQVFDSYKQHIGRVLLDKSVVDNQGNELGSLIRQGVVIDSVGKVIGFINSEGKALNAKGEMIGCAHPDGSVFAKEKFVGAVMPVGRVISQSKIGSAEYQVGSVYPDAQVMSLDLKKQGVVLPDGTAVGEKNKTLGMVTPWGTAIAPDCQLLGLISLNGTVVSTNGSVIGYITRDKNVQNLKGEIIGMVTPTGIQINDQNQVIGRIGFDGKIINDKGEVIGCVNSSKTPPRVMSNSTRGVVVDENGYPTGWSFVAGKTYDAVGVWKGDVLFNGWVVGDKGQLTGVVPFSGAVFSDKGEIVARYNQMSGFVLDLSGKSVGRVLPNMTVINHKGTDILGVLIPEKTIFVDMQGNVLGTLQADGVLLNDGKEVPAKILANGSLLDENGKLKGARLHTGPVLNGHGKYIGSVSQNGNFINENGIQSGRVLANGLVVNDQKQVLGKVFPTLSTAISVDGWLGSLMPQMLDDGKQKTYQGLVNDLKGNLVGNISAYDNVVGLDETIKGNLIPIAPFVNTKGVLMGWGNFKGEVNGPDGRVVASILPSGIALNSAQQIQGVVVHTMPVVGTRGEYLGHTTSKGQLLSDKGEVLAIVGFSRLIYSTQGVLLGQMLPPGIALDANGQLIGWTRYDGQIEDGTKVIGQVGLDGHVFDEKGQMIGIYEPLGMTAFSNLNKSLGWIGEKGEIINTTSSDLAKTLTWPFVSDKTVLKGRLLSRSPMTGSLNSIKLNGIVASDGSVHDVLSRREKGMMMTTMKTIGNSGLIDGGVLPMGSVIGTTLGMLGQLYPDGVVYNGTKKIANTTALGFVFSLTGELLGGVYTPGVIIDKKGKIVGASGPTSAVMFNGKQVANKMAFTSALTTTNGWLGNLMPKGAVVDEKRNLVGLTKFDGSVFDGEGKFIGRVLPDGSVAGVPQSSVYNTMPYIGHTVIQGLALGLKEEVLGRISSMGQLLDKDGKSIGAVADSAFIHDNGGAPIGVSIPFVTAIAKGGGALMGTVSPEGKILSLNGEIKGTVATNRTVNGSHELQLLGRLVPDGLIVNNCKVIGQPAYDGRVINGQGAVVGRIITDGTAVDGQNNKIGYVSKIGPMIGKNGYLGRSLPDGTAVDIQGVEIACVTEDGGLIDPHTGEKLKDVKIFEPGLVIEGGQVVAVTTLTGGVISVTGEPVGPLTIDGVPGHPEWKYVDPNKRIIWGDDGKIKIIVETKGDDTLQVFNPELELIFEVKDDQIFTPGGHPISDDLDGSLGIGTVGYFTNCTWFEYETKRSASLMPDGQLLDESGSLYGFMSPSGEITAPNGTLIDKIFAYNLNLQECGLVPDDPTERNITWGNKKLRLEKDGIVKNENNEVIGTLIDGILIGLDGEKLPPPTQGQRPRPPKTEPIKIDQDQLEQIQQKMAKKRQSMRQGLGGKPLVMSKEMQARFKPKKDKDWSSLGIDKSISTWPVDMSRVILQGRAIPAVLARSLDSRSSDSTALAIVETNIYAEEGRNILIPAGSQLMGDFSQGNSGTNGVAKVEIAWKRLVRPDGVSFDLSDSPSGDAMGRGGVAAYLDRQLFKKYVTPFMGLMAETMFLQAYQMTSPDSNKLITVDSSGDTQKTTMTEAQRTREEIRQLWLGQLEIISEQLINEFSQTPPVLYVPIGTRLTVILKKDLWLRSADDDEAEADQEYGEQPTEAMRPNMPSWEENRRQQLKNVSDRPQTKSYERTNTRNNINRVQEKNINKEIMETPLYDGSDRMNEDLEERVVQPYSETMNESY